VSKPIKINERTKKFKKAEIRMHWVPQLAASCFVRAFRQSAGRQREQPKSADQSIMPVTSRSSATASAMAVRAIATCRRRARVPSINVAQHNMPRNHRLDVTKAVQRLMERDKKLDENCRSPCWVIASITAKKTTCWRLEACRSICSTDTALGCTEA